MLFFISVYTFKTQSRVNRDMKWTPLHPINMYTLYRLRCHYLEYVCTHQHHPLRTKSIPGSKQKKRVREVICTKMFPGLCPL